MSRRVWSAGPRTVVVMKANCQRGFSLIEMMIASAILLIGVAGVLLSLPNAEQGVAAGAMAGRAALYARERLDSLGALDTRELTGRVRLEPYEDRPEGLFWRRWWVLDAASEPEIDDDEELAETLAEHGLTPADFDLPRGFLRLKVRLDWAPPGGAPRQLEVGRLAEAGPASGTPRAGE